jgi:hypothetical protein
MGERRLSVSLDDLEMGQVNMRRVGSAEKSQLRFVAESPEFNLAELNLRVRSVRIEALSIDHPYNRRQPLPKA